MIAALEAETRRKLIVMPRGTFKSSLGCVSFPIWSLLKRPNLRILLDSEIYDNSKNFIREIRGKLESDRITRLFGDFRSDQWAEGSITVKQRTKVLKESSITASGIGANKTGQHYDLIIMDDMNSGKNSNTKELRQKVVEHYRMNTAILEPGGTIVVIGTRYSADDLIGWILEKEIKGLLTPDYTVQEIKSVKSQKIYLLVGTPGSGKTWIAQRLGNDYLHLAHDDYRTTDEYLSEAKRLARTGSAPLIIETPFSVSNILDPLKKDGYNVTPLFVIESEQVTRERYQDREGKPIPTGHITRIKTYIDRANQLRAFRGTSQEVLEHLLISVQASVN